MAPRVALVVLSYNGLADTRKCLSSLAEQAQAHPEILSILVDNGSTDSTADAVRREFPWCAVHRVEQNRGPSAGNNRGIEFALAQGAEWVVLLNNDTTVVPDFLQRMAEMAAAPQGFSILGPVINFMDEPGEVMTDGVRFNPPGFMGFFERVVVPVGDSWPPSIVDVDVVNGCCMMIAAAVVRSVGLFDESLFIYHDESDYCLRAQLAGFRAGVFGRQLVWHKGGRSFVTTGQTGQRYYDSRNLGILVWRYAGNLRARRGRLRSAIAYVRYTYHRYCLEREGAQLSAADAVLEGLFDAIRGWRGPRPSCGRPGLTALRTVFEAARGFPG